MTAAERCAAGIRRIGCTCTLYHGAGQTALEGSLQLMHEQSQPNAGPLGFLNSSTYLLYVPADAQRPLCGDRIAYRDDRYTVCHSESVFFSGETVYYKITLRRESEEATA